MTKVATEKMIRYAQSMAKNLNIEEPNFYCFDDTFKFINKYVELNNKVRQRNTDLEQLELMVNKANRENKNISKNFMQFVEEDKLANKSGVYMLWSENKLAYVGKSTNLGTRVLGSLKDKINNFDITHISYIITSTEADCHILEPLIIVEKKPIINVDCNSKDTSKLFSLEKIGIDINDYSKINIYE